MHDRAIKCFLTVVETGSFTKAAQVLFISQPSVSRHIAELECEWNLKLFEREAKVAKITPQGEMMYQSLKKITKLYDESLANAQGCQGVVPGRLRIGMVSGWHVDQVPMISHFQQKHPHVQVEIWKFSYGDLNHYLLDGTLDMSIVSENWLAKENSEIVHTSIATFPMLLHIAAIHPQAKARSIDELGNVDVLVPDVSQSIQAISITKHWMQENNWDFTVVPYPNLESVMAGVERGLGAAFTNHTFFTTATAKDKVFFDTDIPIPLVCAWHKENDNDLINTFVHETLKPPLHWRITDPSDAGVTPRPRRAAALPPNQND